MGLNMNENWFEIVEILRNTLDSNYSKAEFVSAVENCFRVLGWRKTNGSLIKNYNLPNGSNVDIVLSKTYGENVQSDYIPVFIQCGEFQYNETDNVSFAMDELLTEAAISFGSCIKFFYRNNQDIILSKEILLEESNHEGIQISDLLLFQHFKKSLVHDYITSLNVYDVPCPVDGSLQCHYQIQFLIHGSLHQVYTRSGHGCIQYVAVLYLP